MNCYANEIKEAVTMRQVASLYNIRVNRAGFALCPFHREKTPSVKIYDGQGGYHCFGCGKSGDVIGFVMDMEGATFQEACQKLNEAFSLGLPIGRKQSRREARDAARRAYERRRQREAEKRAAESLESAYWQAYDAWLCNSSIIEKNAPKTELDGFSDEWVEAVHRQNLLEYELELAEIDRYEHQERV